MPQGLQNRLAPIQRNWSWAYFSRSLPEDAKAFLEKSISELDEQIEQKTQAVQQLENEISDMQTKATAYRYLLEQGIDESDTVSDHETDGQDDTGE